MENMVFLHGKYDPPSWKISFSLQLRQHIQGRARVMQEHICICLKHNPLSPITSVPAAFQFTFEM